MVRGQYTFPFSFLLPASMPASMYRDNSNFIQYSIEGVIPNFQDLSNAQAFKLNFHVREPPRGVLSPIRGESTSESMCCGCCCSCGVCKLILESNVTHIENGKVFNVRGHVDTSMSKAEIKSIKVILREKTIRVADCGRVKYGQQDTLIHDSLKKVPVGANETFEAEVGIPPIMTGYTAIGNIFSRAYYLALEA